MHKSKIGLVLGRFQPFHKGHLYLIQKALQKADKIIIAIGSSNRKGNDNPLSYRTRRIMLEKVLEEEGLTDKVIKIVPLPDNPSDDIWLERLLKKTGGFDIVFGNNVWPNGILRNAGYTVATIPYKNRTIYQGTYIRTIFTAGGNWQKRIPSYLVHFVENHLSKVELQ